MSIDVHWFSTLFGWYLFSGMWVSFMIMLNLGLIWLAKQRILPGGYVQSHARYFEVDVRYFNALELLVGKPVLAHLVREHSGGGNVLHPAFFLRLPGAFPDHLLRELRRSVLHIIAEGHQAQCEIHRSSGDAHLPGALSRTCICLLYPGRCSTTMNSVFLR